MGRVVCLHTQRNCCHFWRVKYSFKLGKASLHRYHLGQNVCRICSIWHGFRDTSIFVFCNFCKKFENSKRRHFWEVKYSLKLGKARLHRYPVGQKFCPNCSILHGFRDTSIFVFCNFCKKFENSKWLPFLAGQNIFENWVTYSAELPCGSKISSKSLYLCIFVFYFLEKNFKNSKWPLLSEIFAKTWKVFRGFEIQAFSVL